MSLPSIEEDLGSIHNTTKEERNTKVRKKRENWEYKPVLSYTSSHLKQEEKG